MNNNHSSNNNNNNKSNDDNSNNNNGDTTTTTTTTTNPTTTTTTTTRTNTMKFPFDCIIVTSPDASSSESAQIPLSKILKRHFDNNKDVTNQQQQEEEEEQEEEESSSLSSSSSSVRILSTYDPYGARCGSGGGTIAALQEYKNLIIQTTKTRNENTTTTTTNDDDDTAAPDAADAAAAAADDDVAMSMIKNDTILIIHSGGDSSRCPTQMILGKAWMTLPTTTATTNNNNNNNNRRRQYDNTTIWLIQQIHDLFQTITFPKGTIVVMASDCLLSLFPNINNNSNNNNATTTSSSTSTNMINLSSSSSSYLLSKESSCSVIGLAVPAIVETAQNHGVYILPSTTTTTTTTDDNNNTPNIFLQDPLDVWQKPSLQKLIHTIHPAPASFLWKEQQEQKQEQQDMKEEETKDDKNDDNNNNNNKKKIDDNNSQQQQQRMSWIDTGVIIFLPDASQKLYHLANETWSLCTKQGIQIAYEKEIQQKQIQQNQNQQQQDQKKILSIEEYAKQNALKIDLYTDILHNLSWTTTTTSSHKINKPKQTTTTTTTTIETTNNNNNNNNKTTISEYSEIWKDYNLRILCIRNGQFLHLGTTKELLSFVTNNNNNHPNDDNNNNSKKIICNNNKNVMTLFRQQLGLISRYKCWIDDDDYSNHNDSNNKNNNNNKEEEEETQEQQTSQSQQQNNVIMWSTIPKNTKINIGKSSMIEYCDFMSFHHHHNHHHHYYYYYQSIILGNCSILSGWRNIRNHHHKKNKNKNSTSSSSSTTTGRTRTTNNNTKDPSIRHLVIPDNISVQMLPLKQKYVPEVVVVENNNNNNNGSSTSKTSFIHHQQNNNNTTTSNNNNTNHNHNDDNHNFVWMVMNVQDDIKISCNNEFATIYGLSIHDFFTTTGLVPNDIGWSSSSSSSSDCLWTAKIHPIVIVNNNNNINDDDDDDESSSTIISFDTYFSWLQLLPSSSSTTTMTTTTTTTTMNTKPSSSTITTTPSSSSCCNNTIPMNSSFQKWKNCNKVSLKQLHTIVNANKEWKYRVELENKINNQKKEKKDDNDDNDTTTTTKRTTKQITTTNEWICMVQKYQKQQQKSCHDKSSSLTTTTTTIMNVEVASSSSSRTIIKECMNDMENIVFDHFTKNQIDDYGICGRLFMMASTLLRTTTTTTCVVHQDDNDESSSSQQQQEEDDDDENKQNQNQTTITAANIQSFCNPCIQTIGSITHNNNNNSSSSSLPKRNALQIIYQKMKQDLNNSFDLSCYMIGYSIVMEQLSFCMNKLCIAAGYTIPLQSLLLSSRYCSATKTTRTTTTTTTTTNMIKTNNDNNKCRNHHNAWTIAMAPARVDLSGGWSDTPPMCYEMGGSVTGVAVLLNNCMPLSCRCRIVHGKKGIFLRSENREPKNGSLVQSTQVEVVTMKKDLQSFRDPLSDCALLKCALVCMNIITEEDILNSSCSGGGGSDDDDDLLQTCLDRYFSSNDINNKNDHVRLEIITTSLLPQGSGMGTSSILAACVLSSIAQTAGLGQPDDNFLLHGVLMLEQLLTSGGGWQDQAHGILSGFKTVRSKPRQIPLELTIDKFAVETNLLMQLQERMLLLYTGKTRLAKNILQNVLQKWSYQTNDILTIMKRNIQLSKQCRTSLIEGNMEQFITCLNEYSQIKLTLTNQEQNPNDDDDNKNGNATTTTSNSLPESCEYLIHELEQRKLIVSSCFCGAGGGGFMILITSPNVNYDHIHHFIHHDLALSQQQEQHDISTFDLYKCQISHHHGLVTKTIHIEDDNTNTNKNNESLEQNTTINDVPYNLDWQRVN